MAVFDVTSTLDMGGRQLKRGDRSCKCHGGGRYYQLCWLFGRYGMVQMKVILFRKLKAKNFCCVRF